MTDVVLQLIGGPLDGLFLPTTPDSKTLPHRLIIYSPSTAAWSCYTDPKRRSGPVDCYKIRAGAMLITSSPPGMTVANMHYAGPLSPEAAQSMENMARNRRL